MMATSAKVVTKSALQRCAYIVQAAGGMAMGVTFSGVEDVRSVVTTRVIQ